jgi:hypothetical protein
LVQYPEDPALTQTHQNLKKKSKKKGLTIQEFEMMKLGEPKRTIMLRAWNDHKAKVLEH